MHTLQQGRRVPPSHPDSATGHLSRPGTSLDLDARASPVRFLIRDRDTKFSRSFDEVVRSPPHDIGVISRGTRKVGSHAFTQDSVATTASLGHPVTRISAR
jgi:hypothetical protein